jgi:hypothetical protein
VDNDSFFYQGDGTLMWRGYTFGTPVKTITRTAGDGQEGRCHGWAAGDGRKRITNTHSYADRDAYTDTGAGRDDAGYFAKWRHL